MSQIRRRVAVAAAAALALGLSVGSAGPAAAAPTDPPSYVKSWLALDTGASNTVRLVNADKTLSGSPQVLSGGKACSLNEGGAGLLDFSSTPASPGVGFSGGGIGVREKTTSSGTSCAAVDAAKAESLTLTLGNGVGSLVAMSASLDIDLKQSARILASASLSTDPAGTPPALFELQSGVNIGATPTAGATVFTCNNPADSGPDSGANNNCRWEISAPTWTRVSADPLQPGLSEDGVQFDTLTLTALAGSFSLMGGADGPVADPAFPLPQYLGADQDPNTNDVSIVGASIFELVEGELDCGETATLSGPIASSWTRLQDFTGGDCQPFPYSSRTGTDDEGAFAEFTKPLDYQTAAHALWTTTFVVGAGNTIPPIRVYLDRADGTQIEFSPLVACPDEYWVNGAFVGPSVQPTAPTACLVDAVRGSGKLNKSVTYTAYIYGDAFMRR
ncbi:MAG: hypothetical protein K0R30_150 [Ornithinibacter sp.]|jgi:hypothetical protein|nr:hypothetical protein [Ornithinibacter sp.]